MTKTKLAKARKEARKMCRHTVVFDDMVDITVAVRAMQGRTTKAIASEIGISPAMVQYRIIKAQRSVNQKFRSDYRNGTGTVTLAMMRATEKIGVAFVRGRITPKFKPQAA